MFQEMVSVQICAQENQSLSDTHYVNLLLDFMFLLKGKWDAVITFPHSLPNNCVLY